MGEGDELVYGVRPEYVVASPGSREGAPGGDEIRGTVSAVENLGVNVLVTADAGEQSVRAVLPEAEEPELGDVVICPEAAQDPLGTLAVHGLLHLLGYDHEVDEGEMLALQDRLVDEAP